MKIDLYTKIVLTVIAVCLIALVVRGGNFIGTANARDTVDVRIVGIDEREIGYGVLPVKVKSGDRVDVNIANMSSAWPLKVEVTNWPYR